MPDDSKDIFVKFVKDNKAIPGEATSVVGGDLFAGFKTGYMFEIESFKFAISISDDSDSQQKPEDGAKHDRSSSAGAFSTIGKIPTDPKELPDWLRKNNKPKPQSHGSFKAFQSGKGRGLKYPVSVQPISITRSIDKSSTNLLQHCIDTTLFDSVSVVKRKAAGSVLAGQPYLRMDLVGVLMRDISWSNDEPITEDMKLISRAITIRYKPQLPDGTLGAAKIGFWSMAPDATVFQW